MKKNYFLTICAAYFFLPIFSYTQVTPIIQHPTCENTSGGSISLIVEGGVAPYSFEWDGFDETSSVLSGLSAGEYCVIVLDALCCQLDGCFIINEIIEGNVTSVSTYGISNGSIDLIINSDNQLFTVTWTDNLGNEIESGSNLTSITDLSCGVYCVVITFNTNCEISKCFNVEIENTSNIIKEDITCVCPNGYGAIEIEVEGVTNPNNLEFLWTGPNGFTSTDQNLTNLQDGDEFYYLTVTDENGCEFTKEVQLPYCEPMFYETGVNHACEGAGTGSINVEMVGDVGEPVIFLWTYNGQAYTPNSLNITPNSTFANNLSGGEYCVTILTNNGCFANECWTIEEYTTINNFDYEVTPVTTNGEDGEINLIVQGDEDYSYLWNIGDTTPDLEELEADEYTVTISYGNSADPCEFIQTIIVYNCQVLESNVSLESGTVITTDLGTKEIHFPIIGGEGYSFSYEWSGPGNYSANTPIATEITEPGEYCVIVTHIGCSNFVKELCVDVCDFFIKRIEPITEPPYGCGGVEMIVQVAGGSNLSYVWSDNSTMSTIIMDYGVEYCVTVTDETGCSLTACELFEYGGMEINTSATNSVVGMNSGAVEVNVTGAWEPFTYSWDSPLVSGTGSNGLPPGLYCVTITDFCGNTEERCLQVTCVFEESQITACMVIEDVDCNSGELGSITINESCLPDGDFQFKWSNGTEGVFIENLMTGEYCVTVADVVSQCFLNFCVEVNTNGSNSFDVSFETVLPQCGNDGQITAFPQGGISPYIYEWIKMGGSFPVVGNTQTILGIDAGWYFVNVVDNIGCKASGYTYVNQGSSGLNVTGNVNHSCIGGNNGSIAVTASGGIPPYSYNWEGCFPCLPINTTTAPYIGQLEAGLYMVTVTDNEGCVGQRTFHVLNSSLSVSAEIFDICSTGGIGKIELDVLGESPFDYIWSNGKTTQNIDVNNSGNYSVTVTDDIGCEVSETFTVSEISSLISIELISAQGVTCEYSNDGIADFLIIGGEPPYKVRYKADLNSSGFWQTISNIEANTFSISNLEYGEGVIYVEQAGSWYCPSNELPFQIGIVGDVEPLSIILDSYSYPCEGKDGLFSFSVTGGVPPYSYYWIQEGNANQGPTINHKEGNDNTVEVTSSINYFPMFTITITDGTGCSISKEYSICDCVAPIQAFIDPREIVSCSNGFGAINKVTVFYTEEGTEDIIDFWSDEGFQYEWAGPNNFTANTKTINNLTDPGEYCITITKLDGCNQGLEIERCVILDCTPCSVTADFSDKNDCAPGHIKLSTVSPLDSYYFLEWSDGEKGIIRMGSSATAIDTSPLDPFPDDENILDIILYHKNTTYFGPYHIDRNKTGLGPGIFHGKVTSFSGCSDFGFVEVYDGDHCIYSLEMGFPFSPNSSCDFQNEVNYTAFSAELSNHNISDGNFIGRCFRFNPCSQETERGPIVFTPSVSADFNDLCNGGGTIGCLLCSSGDFIDMIVPPGVGTTITIDEETCGCIFEPGSIIDPVFLNAAYDGGVSDPYSLPVVAFMDCPLSTAEELWCETEDNGPNITITIGGPLDNVDDFCEEKEFCINEGGCVQVANIENCSYDIYCKDDTMQENSLHSEPAYWYCYELNALGGCTIKRQCRLKPCNRTTVYSCPDSESACIGNTEIQAFLPEVTECVFPGCSCEDFADFMPKCIQCPMAFVSNSNNTIDENVDFEIWEQPKIKPTSDNGSFESSVFPNPFKNKLTLEINSNVSSKIEVQVLNLLGNKYLSNEYEIVNGNNVINLNLPLNITNGVYQIFIIDKQGNYTTHRIVRANN